MKFTYDPDADALTIRWNESPIVESDEKEPGFILDYDAEGQVVGVEILDVSDRLERPLPVPEPRASAFDIEGTPVIPIGQPRQGGEA